jgi:hypothetical protein
VAFYYLKDLCQTGHVHQKRLLRSCPTAYGEINIIRAPNTTKKFNELLVVFFIGKEGLPVWLL